MKRSISRWLLFLTASCSAALAAFACGDLEEYYTRGNGNGAETGSSESSVVSGKFSRPTKGSAIDVSEDDSQVVVVNRDDGSITIFEATYPGTPSGALSDGKVVVKVCNENSSGDRGQPWQVVLHPNGDTAFVVCRSEQVVAKVVGIRSKAPSVEKRVPVGAEPTGIALTPRATFAWVANWVDGTIQRIRTDDMTVEEPVDLNAPLVGADAGYLGAVNPRRALAHPRSIAITNDGDDDESDESLFVTEYFAQQKTELAANGSNADTARVGVLYRIELSNPTAVNVIELPPGEMGFLDANNKAARCFPNQLQSVTVNGNAAVGRFFAYITSVCASPMGPLGIYSPTNQPVACSSGCAYGTTCDSNGKCTPNTNGVKTTTTPAITVIDLANNQAVDNGTIALNYDYTTEFYDKDAVLKDTKESPARRLPLLANDIAFLPGGFRAVVTAGGADALFRLTFNVAYDADPVEERGPGPFVNLTLMPPELDDHLPIGPVGVVVAHSHPHAFVANDGARTAAMIDLQAGGGGAIVSAKRASSQPSALTDKMIAKGKRLFNFGLGRWSMNGQGWGACSVCHVDGLTDNVTWFFPRGPRQSTSIDGFFDRKASGEPDQRNFGWNAGLDEASDLDNNVLRNLFGGTGAIVTDAKGDENVRVDLSGDRGLNGSAAKVPGNVLPDWADIVEFLKSVRTPRRPTGLAQKRIEDGLAVAQKYNCAACHGGPLWTVSTLFYDPQHQVADAGPDAALTNNEKLKSMKWDAGSMPSGVLPTTDDSARTMRYAGTSASLDSLTCALRNVETFNKAELGVGIAELRENMTTPAQGGGSGDIHDPKGYNPPSLFGLAVGAPYFHAGNARTLEAALSDGFRLHHAALKGASFVLSDTERDDLIVFLLAIDRSAASPQALAVPSGSVLCAKP